MRWICDSGQQRGTSALTALILATVFVAGYILWRFPPQLYSFYPQCPIYVLLHLQCPGCGMTRSLASLLHGDLSESLRLNALLVILVIPSSVGYAALRVTGSRLPRLSRPPMLRRLALYAIIVGVAIFTVYRNR